MVPSFAHYACVLLRTAALGTHAYFSDSPQKAIKAAILGRKFVCGMTGLTGFSYIEDVARIFTGCTRAKVEGAPCFNIRGEVTTAEDFMEIGG